MEGGQLPLDGLLDGYQRGAELLQFCRARLEAVEQQVKVLEDGQLKPWPTPTVKRDALRRLVRWPSSTRVESALDAWVPADAPAGLGDAMRYAVLDGGKRLRPLLVLAAAEAVQRRRARRRCARPARSS